ncbi:MAG: exodeoxyribonuclease VII large subunit, partial [Gammaproteobacteria bacterium]
MNDFSPPDPGQRRIFSVAELNRTARALLEGEFPSIWVEGEISNLARPASGHLYFSLKDSKAQVRCALFKNRALGLKTRPENGMQVLLRAGVSLYEGRGEFQLIVEYLEPAGAGALQRAFEELKRKLEAEGLFDPAHKQTLPAFPKRIGVITSPSGAAIRDVLNVLKRRYPGVEVIIYPAPVQGADAPAKLKRMLDVAIARNEVDVLLLTRGGGSLEDLWAFNDEPLARAIHACPLPIVSAVGHEIDFTIADFVADQRAATPSAAAELLSPDQTQLLRQLARYESLLDRQMQQQLRSRKDRINSLQKRLPHPQRTLQQISQRLDDLTLRSQRAIKT